MSALLMFLLPNLLDWMVKGLDRALAALIRAAYAPVLPVAATDPSHALRLAARMRARDA